MGAREAGRGPEAKVSLDLRNTDLTLLITLVIICIKNKDKFNRNKKGIFTDFTLVAKTGAKAHQ